MKKILVTLTIVFAFYTKAQIIQETTYANAGINGVNTLGNLSFEYLSSAGYKYSVKTLTTITLYNLNHSVYTTMNTPNVGTLPASIAHSIFGTSVMHFSTIIRVQ